MAVKTTYTTADKLFSTPLPNHAATYTVISHRSIVDDAMAELNNAGFNIQKETYKSNLNGEVAYGIYTLDHAMDADISMMFAWGNTYDKSRRFRCAVGANVTVSDCAMINGEQASYARKHTGNADHEAKEQIQEQIKIAVQHYNQLLIDKDALLNQRLSKRQQSEILGVLTHDMEVINLTQVALIQKELKKASHDYSRYDLDSAFVLYNHIGQGLKDSHAAVWMDNQQDMHRFFINEFGRIIDTYEEPRIQVVPEAHMDEAIRELVAQAPVNKPVEVVELAQNIVQKRSSFVFM
jgi:hypothetical protein